MTGTSDLPLACAAGAGGRRFLLGLAAGIAVGAACGWLLLRERDAATPEKAGPSPVASTEATDAPADAELPLDHERYMRACIAQARLVPQLPFGAVLVDTRSGAIVAEGHNRSSDNPTWHGEIDVINRLAAQQRDVDWSALALYTTAEPCPMCQAAIEWAGIGWVVYGSSIPFLQQLGWWQIDLRADEVIRRTPFRKTNLLGGVLEDECNQLFLAVPKGLYRRDDSSPRK